ncbi:MAG: phage late control D family protein [Alphaproteobacteria bacterium]|nr:phage late control D family protein [Alphaproteobacteria bacterium]
MSNDLVRSATSYKVTVNGQEFSQTQADGLAMLVVEDHVELVQMLTLRMGGAEDRPTWNAKIGDTVTASLGEGGSPLFEGEVIGLEPSYQVDGVSSMTIRALDKAHRLGRGRKTRFWEDMKDSDVVSEVGAECGLSVDADATSETLPYILQRNESNLAFLKRLAARNNYILRVEASSNKLLFKKASFQGSSVKVKMGENLRSMRMAFNSSDQVQKVVVRGWDVAAKKEIVGEATTGDITSIGGGEVGASVAGAFGDSTAYITDVPVSSQSMANAVAKSELERLARSFGRGTASVQGNDKIRAGTIVEFEGLPSGQNGKYFVLSTRHVISGRTGYTTEFTFCSNTMGS